MPRALVLLLELGNIGQASRHESLDKANRSIKCKDGAIGGANRAVSLKVSHEETGSHRAQRQTNETEQLVIHEDLGKTELSISEPSGSAEEDEQRLDLERERAARASPSRAH